MKQWYALFVSLYPYVCKDGLVYGDILGVWIKGAAFDYLIQSGCVDCQ